MVAALVVKALPATPAPNWFQKTKFSSKKMMAITPPCYFLTTSFASFSPFPFFKKQQFYCCGNWKIFSSACDTHVTWCPQGGKCRQYGITCICVSVAISQTIFTFIWKVKYLQLWSHIAFSMAFAVFPFCHLHFSKHFWRDAFFLALRCHKYAFSDLKCLRQLGHVN